VDARDLDQHADAAGRRPRSREGAGRGCRGARGGSRDTQQLDAGALLLRTGTHHGARGLVPAADPGVPVGFATLRAQSPAQARPS